MKKIRLTSESARRIALKAQMLDGCTDLPEGKKGVAQTIERLGYIQIDPKADVRKKTFFIRNLIFEKGFDISGEFLRALANRVSALARFNQCTKIKIEKTSPAKIAAALNKLVKSDDVR